MDMHQPHRDYETIARALEVLAEHRRQRPSLGDVAQHVGLSQFHFQRLFSRWVGISPKRFLQFLTVEHARRCLAETRSVLEASVEAGLSSPGRLHDLMVSVDAVTPGEYRRGGAGLTIRCGSANSPFGSCFVAATERGVCWLAFPGEAADESRAELQRHFSGATVVEDAAAAEGLVARIFDDPGGGSRRPPVLLSGTNFQLKVWEALLRIPEGALCSYSDLASAMGRPSATRAVASAVAANHIAVLIPCHRVIRATGAFGQYRWGAARKAALIGWEQAMSQTVAAR
ncbi:MAG: methylated-DNA--[protein]-cysteine S-methyltransferase [Thermoanaerobaculales bacterium]|jgi:AraC family transcriptional regulator of adaptative response/methylated-DNA-[protein]-cysteine methyltransferase|nr:methylated-DNA--[protein]-cysteine S-methyltransferase [Thermoanaerobaculales bacterium]